MRESSRKKEEDNGASTFVREPVAKQDTRDKSQSGASACFGPMDNRQTTAIFSAVFERSPLLMAISEIDSGRYLDVNQRFLEVTGYRKDQVIGKSSVALGLLDEQDRRSLLKELREAGEVFEQERQLKTADGTVVSCLFSGMIICVGTRRVLLTFAQDINERKKLQERNETLQNQVRQAQKLEAIGILAGGIAHDFNNILGSIIGFTDMAIEDIPEGSLTRKNLEKVLQSGYRARDLVGQILAFSRQSELKKVAFKPEVVVKEVVQLLHSVLPRTITINRTVTPDCGWIDADPSKFHQILMNLCTNAYHAMESSGGTLTVALHPARNLPEGLLRSDVSESVCYAELTVSDTGHGISDKVIERIFDPFFTTKDKERGTGMGLSIVHGIASEFGGAVTVESAEGKGATFRVYLPCSKQGQTEIGTNVQTPVGGNEHILLVDDEALLLEMTSQMISRMGYRVSKALNGQEALDLFQADPYGFDLVITDQTMPGGMTGIELSARILSVRSDLPTILCTGYSAGIDKKTAQQNGIKGFLYKPLGKQDLSAMIRSILDAFSEDGAFH